MDILSKSHWFRAGYIFVFLSIHVDADVTWTVTSFYVTDYKDRGGIYYIKENHPVSLVCSYDNLRVDKLRYLRWNKADPENPINAEQIYFSPNNDGVTGSLQGRATVQIQDGGTWINISSFNTSLDATTYQCIVCDTDITCQTAILQINDIKQLELPQVYLERPEYTLTEGENFTLVCSVHGGYPTESPSSYSWSFESIYDDIVTFPHDEEMSSVSEGSNIILKNNSSGEVFFTSASYYHYGLFQCFAQVTGGTVSNSTDISVYYSPRLLNSTDQDVYHKPIGSNVLLHLTFRSHSQYNISVNWTYLPIEGISKQLRPKTLLKDGEPRDSYDTSMEINNIGLADFGTYRCQIGNGLLDMIERQFYLYIELPWVDQASLWYTRRNSEVNLSWGKPEGPYTGVSLLQCKDAPVQCTEHIITDPYTTTTLILTVQEDKAVYEYYLVLYQNGVEVLRSDKFSLREENDDSVFGIIAGLTAAVIVTIVIVVPVCLIKVTGCRKKDESKETRSGKQKMYRWVTRLRKSIKRSKRKKSFTDLTLQDIEEESESKVQQEDSTSKSEEKPSSGIMSTYSMAQPRRELKLIPRSCVLDESFSFLSVKKPLNCNEPPQNFKEGDSCVTATGKIADSSDPEQDMCKHPGTPKVKTESTSMDEKHCESNSSFDSALMQVSKFKEEKAPSELCKPSDEVYECEKSQNTSEKSNWENDIKESQVSKVNTCTHHIDSKQISKTEHDNFSADVQATSEIAPHSIGTESSPLVPSGDNLKDIATTWTTNVTHEQGLGLAMNAEVSHQLNVDVKASERAKELDKSDSNVIVHRADDAEGSLIKLKNNGPDGKNRDCDMDNSQITEVEEQQKSRRIYSSDTSKNTSHSYPEGGETEFNFNAKGTNKLNNKSGIFEETAGLAADVDGALATEETDEFTPVEYEV